MTQPSSFAVRMLSALSILLLPSAFPPEVSAQDEIKRFVVERKALTQATLTKKLAVRINRPKAPRGSSLARGLEVRGCWIAEHLNSVAVRDSKKKKVKFKKSKDGTRLELKRSTGLSFPLSAVFNLKSEVTRVSRGGSIIARGQTNCRKVKRKNGSTRLDCSASQPVAVFGAFSGVECSLPSDFESQSSPGEVVFADGDSLSIRPRTAALRFAMSEGSFLPDVSDATVLVNGEPFSAPDVALVDGALELSAPLLDGLNEVSVRAQDQDGLQADGEFRFWAGSSSLTVRATDENGQTVPSGGVTVRLADDPDFFQTQALAGGEAVFGNMPSTTVAVSLLTPDGRSGFSAGSGADGVITVVALPLLEESSIANNDISGGTAGWTISPGANVSVIPHVEDDSLGFAHGSHPQAAEGPDQDLVLSTSGEGPRFMTRTFRTNPRSRLVRIRYRFQTSEFPGGYFGSRFNDFYNVSLRSSRGANILDDGSSMNALGRAAFSPSGFTVWKSTVIPVNRTPQQPSEGEVVQATVLVANVADGAFDSRVVVDKIEESPFAISEAALFDIDNQPLRFISADSHSYFDQFTWIHGTITLEGEKDDKVTEVYLQLMDGSNELGRAELSTQAASRILNKKFGKSGKLAIATPQLLFKIFPQQLADLARTSDQEFSLVIQARTAKGYSAHTSVGRASQLVRYSGTNRYDGRDELMGGDDWVRPSVRELVNQLAGVTWGDFSNMNGGRFPPHELHQTGRSADGWIPGYNSLNAETAESLIALLNSPAGRQIRTMYVRYSRRPGNSFFQAIAGRTLDNGRRVDRVIIPDGAHGTHFHAEF